MKMDWLTIQNGQLRKGDTPFLLRGFGLGGWFLPEGYMWKFYTKCDRPRRMEKLIADLCGEAFAKDFWERYLDGYITENDIALIRKRGFNSVRLPMNARHLYESRNGQLIWKPGMLRRIDRLVEWCEKWEVYIILDMHGAPGGQTGQNIDDCENDYPELFTERKNQEELIWLWVQLAVRYRDRSCIAGYDLLNEPIVNLFPELYPSLLPLYRELISAIRAVDSKHILILEGAHWATDFTVFDEFTKEEAADGIMLQFHKYWNNPDRESLEEYRKAAVRLRVPLFMGEGGENNCDWYTTMFPMLEREGISWSFWSYKKMECCNSPMTFCRPQGWDKLLAYLDGGKAPEREEAAAVLDDFLAAVREAEENPAVWNALNRAVPLRIPAEAFDHGISVHSREEGALLRCTESISLIFAEGGSRVPDYRRYGGEDQPEKERILVKLREGDRVSYRFHAGAGNLEAVLTVRGCARLHAVCGASEAHLNTDGIAAYIIPLGRQPEEKEANLTFLCLEGCACLDEIVLRYADC